MGGSAPARAAGDAIDPLFAGSSLCPTPAAVRAEVEALVPRERLHARLRAAATGAAPPVAVTDLGAPFQITAAGNTREYRDEARDCAHRARVAAVFVVLVIDPAAMGEEAAAPAPAPAPPSPPPPLREAAALSASAAADARAGLAPARVRVGMGAAAEGGVGPDARIGQLGVGLRMGYGAGRLALSVGAAALAPVDATIGSVRVRHLRVPVDAGVRAQAAIAIGARYRLQPYVELGAALALVRESGLDLAVNHAHSAIELGVRGGAGVYLASASRLTPFLSLAGVFVPAPPAVSALPRGVVGHTPSLWLGAAAGVAWGWP